MRRQFLYLSLILDGYCSLITGWKVRHQESVEHAGILIAKTCSPYGARRPKLVLHSDNSSAVKGTAMLATLQYLGVMPLFSRPGVNNNNAYSVARFRVVKCTPRG